MSWRCKKRFVKAEMPFEVLQLQTAQLRDIVSEISAKERV